MLSDHVFVGVCVHVTITAHLMGLSGPIKYCSEKVAVLKSFHRLDTQAFVLLLFFYLFTGFFRSA